MAHIDTSKIEGFDTMSADDKLKALEEYDFPEPDYSGYVKKEVFDKKASESAEWKRKHDALLTEEDKKKQDADEELTALRNKVAEMEKAKVVSDHKAQFLSLGYDEALAAETAKALAEGDNTKVFANHKKFLESHDKAFKAQLMGAGSTPPAGSVGGQGVDYSKLIADATAQGDYPAVAYYTRLQEQSKQNT